MDFYRVLAKLDHLACNKFSQLQFSLRPLAWNKNPITCQMVQLPKYTTKLRQIFRDIRGTWKNDHKNFFLKNFKERPSKLEKGYSQVLVKQTVVYYFYGIEVSEFDPVFHLTSSNMAQRHVAFCERHVALQVRHLALQVRHVALLIFRQWSASLNYCYVIFNPPRPLAQCKTTRSLMSRVHTYDTIPDNGLCT